MFGKQPAGGDLFIGRLAPAGWLVLVSQNMQSAGDSSSVEASGDAARRFSLLRLLGVFDELTPDGGVRCCRVSVVMRNGTEVYCLVCGRRIQELGRQWFVRDWGTRGIKSGDWPAALVVAPGAPGFQFKDGVFRFYRSWLSSSRYLVFRVRLDREPLERARETGLTGRVEAATLDDARAWLADHPDRPGAELGFFLDRGV